MVAPPTAPVSARIRLEANSVSTSLHTFPQQQGASPSPVVIFPPTNAPVVSIYSVSGIERARRSQGRDVAQHRGR